MTMGFSNPPIMGQAGSKGIMESQIRIFVVYVPMLQRSLQAHLALEFFTQLIMVLAGIV